MQLSVAATLVGHTDRVWHCSWSPCGFLLATCSGDKTVRIWRQDRSAAAGASSALAAGATAAEWRAAHVLEDCHKRTIRRCEWSPCGRYLACCSFDGTISVWEREKDGSFDCIATLEGHENEVKSVAWDASGSLLATCSRDKSVWIWSMVEGVEFECISILNGHSQDVKAVRWHPSEQLLVSASYDDSLKLWREAGDDEWELQQSLTGHTGTVWDVAFNSSGSQLVSCSDDCTLRVWSTLTAPDRYTCVATFGRDDHRRTIFSVDWSRTAGLIATGAGDNGMRIYAEDSEVLPPDGPRFRLVAADLSTHPSDVNCVRWSPTERNLLASCCDDGSVRLWRVAPVA